MFFKKHAGLVLFLLFFSSLLIYKLVFFTKPLFDWDESLYVQNGIEMLQQQQFLVPVWQGQPWLDKPPLTILLFGLIAKYSLFPVEISTRLYTLGLSITALVLVYFLAFRASKNKLTALLTVIITSFVPIFLQRTQVVSLDVTLLIGWLGFFLFLNNPIWATLFLLLSVQSKSLLGFYPLFIYSSFLIYQYFGKQIKKPMLIKAGKIIMLQAIFLSLWYLLALLIYKEYFIQAHIIESHFRRVSSSLESHFGQRTFYLDLIREQFGPLFYLSLLGIILSLYRFFKKQISTKEFLSQNAFLPWFIFLNLTKTKIAWYLYPVIPQFAFYSAYPLTLIKNKFWQLSGFIIFSLVVIYQGLFSQNLLGTFYSQEDAHIRAAKYAKQHCDTLAVLVPDYTRETYWTLKKMNLTISTTNWWGEHPSMVYYFSKPMRFFYSIKDFKKQAKQFDCLVINSNDKQLIKQPTRLLKSFDKMLLYQ